MLFVRGIGQMAYPPAGIYLIYIVFFFLVKLIDVSRLFRFTTKYILVLYFITFRRQRVEFFNLTTKYYKHIVDFLMTINTAKRNECVLLFINPFIRLYLTNSFSQCFPQQVNTTDVVNFAGFQARTHFISIYMGTIY